MKTIFTAGLLGIVCLTLHSQSYMWIKEIKGTGQVNPVEIIQDDNNNYYVYGNFNGELKIENLTINAVALQDIFIAKYSYTGDLIWFKHISGSGTESAYGFKLSKEKDAIYFSGVFNSNPINIAGTPIWNNGANDIFLAKMDLNGNIIWAKNVAYGNTHQMGGYFDIDMYGHIIMTGQFISSVTFFGDYGTLSVEPENPVQRQNFIVKFNSEGEWIWSKLVQSSSDLSFIRNISIFNNEYYLSGQIAGVVKYGNTTIATLPTTYRSGIVLRIDLNGNLIWTRKVIPTNSDFYIIKHVYDNNGNQYIAGKFSSVRIRFDSTSTDTSKKLYLNAGPSATNDLFLAKYARNGQFIWAKLFGGNKDENILNLTSLNNQLILSGSHGSKISFGIFTTNYLANSDAFAAVFDNDGNTLNLLSAIGKSNESGNSSAFSSTNRNFVWIGEYHSDTLFIGSHFLKNSFASRRDGFIARYGCFDSIGFSIIKTTCPNASNGSITAIPSFGNEPYTYIWSNGQTTQTISNLPVGNYTVTVTGSNGCTMSRTIYLTHQPLLQASIINVQHINCFGGSTGSATANPIYGTSPYTYNWSNNKTTQTITNLTAGNYTVTIKDACNSTATASVTILQNSKVNASITTTPVTCNGGADGTATAHPIHGLPPYSYKWSNGQITQTAVGLIANTTYKVTVKDACNQTVVKSTILSEPQALSGSIVTYASSPCQPTGVAVITANNGTPSYSYLWNTGATTSIIENLSPGTYSVTIRDACNASKSYSRSVGTKNINITATITCTPAGTCQGSIKANVTGGDPPYSYLWSNGQTTQTAVNLCRGNYRVTVTDALGCTKVSNRYSVPNCTAFTTPNNNESFEDKILISNNIVVYPSPASKTLFVNLPYELFETNFNISIHNLIGQKVYEYKNLVDNELKIDVSYLLDGVYILHIHSKNISYKQKFIILKE